MILARFSFLSRRGRASDGHRRDPDGSQDIGRYVSRDRASRDMLTPSDFLNEPLDHVHHVRCPEVRCPEAAAIFRWQFRWQRQHGCGRSPSPHQHRERRIGSAIQFGSAFQCGLGPPEGRAPLRRGGGFENVVEDPPTSPLSLAGVWSNTLRRKCHVAPEMRLYSKAFGTDYAGGMLLDCLA